MSFPEFLYYADFPFSCECHVEIQDWIRDLNFFKFLAGVDKNIFRTEVVQELFPEALRNIRKYTQLKEKNIQELYVYWKENDISYREFEEYYQNIV